MQTRSFGSPSVQVVPLMLGGNVFGWSADAPTSFQILDAFTSRGFNFIDTADVYSKWAPGHTGGESETVLGDWFTRSGKRKDVILATKAGMLLHDEAGKHGLSRTNILKAAEDSLRRLKTDYIDLYQSHKDDPDTPIEETLAAYQQLIQQGKVRMIGASNYTGPRLTEAIELARREGLPVYQTLQPEYNLHARQDYEQNLAPVAAKYDLGVIPYFSLAAGFLTGKYKTKADARGKARENAVGKYFDDRGTRILAALATVAQETGATEASIALAWLMAQPTVTAPIASATSLSQLESLFAAVDLTLTPTQLQTLTTASAY